MKRILSILAATAVLLLTGCSNDDEKAPVKTPIGEETNIYGVVTDTHGNFIQGVVVSDGFTCNATDKNGVYQLTRNASAYHVYISIPAQYEVPVSEGGPCFWQKLSEKKKRYDFTLKALDGGVENNFKLFCIADPQCQSSTHIGRFENETVPDIAAQVAASDVPCYGITLGDIIFNNASTDVINLMPRMKIAMSQTFTGLPIFQVMGNHDNAVIGVNSYEQENDLEAQRFFEYKFGPVNYSFDRGSVHIVGMDNILFQSHSRDEKTGKGGYDCGFRDDQVEWLRQDLSYVPKDKMVILCVHIPLRNSTSNKNVQTVLSMLEPYSEVHVMSGHTHYGENDIYGKVYEHVHGAACGAWWQSTINTDGTPNGYAIYDIEGSTISNWQYKGTGLESETQIRLYRADEVFPGPKDIPYMFAYYASDQIVANIWNADKNYWKVEVFENGAKTGEMLPFSSSQKRDAWASSYHCYILGRDPKSYDRTNNSHLFYFTLLNPEASVEVRATDKFGNTYIQSQFTTAAPADYPIAN